MRKKEAILFFLLILLALAPAALAKSMTLLAVSKTKDGFAGTSADLELDVKKGSGRVFISTFPLTNVDTQISFRMAKEYACDFLDKDCGKYDFYYVVRSEAPIIGGPSAGGAATLLTISVLDNLNLDPKIAATGTINSGGIIGPVAGIKYKVEAASKVGLRKVLIPSGTRYYDESSEGIAQQMNATSLNLTAQEGNSNNTLDLVEYGRKLGIEVKEVEDITQAIYELTGKSYKQFDESLQMDEKYQKIMRSISEKLCNRSVLLLKQLDNTGAKNYSYTMESSKNLTELGAKAFKEGMYYSAASYCYGANVKYDYIYLLLNKPTNEEIKKKLDAMENDSKALDEKLQSFEYQTIDDMQTYLVVKERLTETQTHISNARKSLQEPESTSDTLYSVSLAVERLYSAYYWSEFFGKGGRTFNIEKSSLSQFCLDKISEADERIQYISNFFMLPMDGFKEDLGSAMADYQNSSYELCIFKASKVKARTNLLLTAIGLRDQDFERVLARKIEIARQAVVKETKRQIFPILGYSYYEYAKSLEYEDPNSAMLYSELSLELSNFDMYFKQENGPSPLNIAGFAISSAISFFALRKSFSVVIRPRTYPKKVKIRR
jgi:uncharacterized protein